MGKGLDDRERGLPWSVKGWWLVPPKEDGEQDEEEETEEPLKPQPDND